MKTPSTSLTVASPAGILRVISTEIRVCAAPDPQCTFQGLQKFLAVWDTGATSSVISKNIVVAAGLKATGITLVHGVHGPGQADTYLVNIQVLPSDVRVRNVTVTVGDLPAGTDALIGMDIITLGDFAITNKDGRTVMSFRFPSLAEIDFVKEHGRVKTPWDAQGRFQHGSGKRSKRKP